MDKLVDTLLNYFYKYKDQSLNLIERDIYGRISLTDCYIDILIKDLLTLPDNNLFIYTSNKNTIYSNLNKIKHALYKDVKESLITILNIYVSTLHWENDYSIKSILNKLYEKVNNNYYKEGLIINKNDNIFKSIKYNKKYLTYNRKIKTLDTEECLTFLFILTYGLIDYCDIYNFMYYCLRYKKDLNKKEFITYLNLLKSNLNILEMMKQDLTNLCNKLDQSEKDYLLEFFNKFKPRNFIKHSDKKINRTNSVILKEFKNCLIKSENRKLENINICL